MKESVNVYFAFLCFRLLAITGVYFHYLAKNSANAFLWINIVYGVKIYDISVHFMIQFNFKSVLSKW